MNIEIKHLTEDQREHYLEHGGIFGSELNGVRTTTDQYDKDLASLRSRMLVYGESGIGDSSPYYINKYADPDFFPCIEVSDIKILAPDLIAIVYESVVLMPPEYRVDICNALCYINDEFSIFVESKVIYAYSSRKDILEMLALNGSRFTHKPNNRHDGTVKSRWRSFFSPSA